MPAEAVASRCPYCGEPVWIEVDPDGGRRQRFVQDCAVCCRPIEVVAERDGDATRVAVATEDDGAGLGL